MPAWLPRSMKWTTLALAVTVLAALGVPVLAAGPVSPAQAVSPVEAPAEIELVMMAKPDDPAYWLQMGQPPVDFSWHNEAIQALSEAVRLDPSKPELYFDLGFAMIYAGKNDEAVALFERALQMVSPTDVRNRARLFLDLAFVYGLQKRPDQQETAAKQSIALDPSLWAAHDELGLAYAAQNRFGEAAKSFEEAVRLNPTEVRPHFLLGLSYVTMGDEGAALGEYEILMNLDPAKAKELFDQIHK